MKTAYAILAVLFTSPAFAVDEPRKIDFTQVVKNLDGNLLNECVENKPDNSACARLVPMTIGRIAAGALTQPDKGVPLPDIVLRGRLAERIIDAKEAVLTSDEVTTIKNSVAKMSLNYIIILRIIEAIDPAAVK